MESSSISTGARMSVARLSAALTAIEDQFSWDAVDTLDAAIALEERANALGAEELAVRARLCQANMWIRQGRIGVAAQRIWHIDKWAAEHGASMVQARANLVWANAHRLLGDPAACLEHSLLAVELLDDTATAHAQVWHRSKLADALSQADSLEAARAQYAQAEELAMVHDLHRLRMAVLNNWAYSEFLAGLPGHAHEVIQRLQKVADRHGLALESSDLDTIGNIQIANGLFAEAEQTLLHVLARSADSTRESADSQATHLLTLATAQRGLGATDRAQASLDASRRICEERGLGEVLVRVHQEQAELYAARGEFAEAFAAHKTFFAAHHRLHSSKREAQARARQAMFETLEARQEAERFREQARRDPLTGLRNRRYVDEQLPTLINDAPLTVAIADLDHFKRINDRLSHDVGDKVLVLVAQLLEKELASVAPQGFVARMGGEEFLMVLPHTSVTDAAARLEQVRVAIRSYAWAELTRGLPVTVSIGVAGTDDVPSPSQSRLLSTADRHLYLAKHGGRDRVVLAGDWDIGVRPARRPHLSVPAADATSRPPGSAVTVPHSARVYDYWLGGKDNFAVDRVVGDAMMAALPGMRAMAVENRKFVRRVTRDLVAKEGFRQFLDIGSGIPHRPNLHEIAQQSAPDTRVVYLDNDPVVLAHAHALLSGAESRCAYVAADLRRPESILDDPTVTGLLDLGRPLAVTAIAVLMLLPDAEDPWGCLRVLMDALPSGSCLALTHPSQDFDPPAMARAVSAVTAAGMTLVPRSRAEVLRFFGDWELLDPGLVPVKSWRPDGRSSDDPESAHYWAGVARKR